MEFPESISGAEGLEKKTLELTPDQETTLNDAISKRQTKIQEHKAILGESIDTLSKSSEVIPGNYSKNSIIRWFQERDLNNIQRTLNATVQEAGKIDEEIDSLQKIIPEAKKGESSLLTNFLDNTIRAGLEEMFIEQVGDTSLRRVNREEYFNQLSDFNTLNTILRIYNPERSEAYQERIIQKVKEVTFKQGNSVSMDIPPALAALRSKKDDSSSLI